MVPVLDLPTLRRAASRLLADPAYTGSTACRGWLSEWLQTSGGSLVTRQAVHALVVAWDGAHDTGKAHAMTTPKTMKATKTQPALRTQLRQAKQHLRALTTRVSGCLAALDALLMQPESYKRSQELDLLVNALDLANDRALHFGLGQTFPALEREKRRLTALAATQYKGTAQGSPV